MFIQKYAVPGAARLCTVTMARILVIDSDAEFFRLLEEYLGSRGFVCFHAVNIRRGLKKLGEAELDALLLDAALLDLEGARPELAAFLRGGEKYRQLPVIMFTSRGEDLISENLELGADFYLAKPFHPRELEAVLQMLLRSAPPHI